MATSELKLVDVPYFMQTKSGSGKAPIAYTAAQFRSFTSSIIRRTGILGANHFLVTQSPNVGMTVTVNSGYARVGGVGANYIVQMGSDTDPIPLTGFITNPPATRTHKVFIAVYDGSMYESGDDYEARIVITEDPGGGAPTPPNQPAAFLEIATIAFRPNMPNIQNGDITNTARHGGGGSENVDLVPTLDRDNYLNAGEPGFTADYRATYNDGAVRLAGAIKKKDGKPFPGDADFVIGYMHSNLRPQRIRYLTCACSITEPHTTTSGTYTCRLSIDIDGTMTIAMPVGQTPKYIFFDGVTYDLD